MLDVFHYAIYGMCAASLLFGLCLLIWRLKRWKEDPLHTLSICSIVSSNIITGIYFLLIIVLSNTAGVEPKKDEAPRWQYIRQFAGVLSSVGIHTNLGFVFLQIVDRTICLYHAFNVIGMTPRQYVASSVSMWVLGTMLAVAPFLPVDFFHRYPYSTSFCLLTSQLKYTHQSVSDTSLGWQYVFSTQVVLHGMLHLVGMILLCITGAKVKNTPPEMMTQQRRIEISFFYQILGISVVNLACWTPNVMLGKVEIYIS